MANEFILSRVVLLAKGTPQYGELKLHPSGIAWQSSQTDRVVTIESAGMGELEWSHVGKQYVLCVGVKGGSIVRFGGFKAEDVSVLREYVEQHFAKELKQSAVSAKGTNWGDVEVEAKMVTLRTPDGTPIMTIPLSDVAQAIVQGKSGNEIALDFHADDSEYTKEVETMERMTLMLPTIVDAKTGGTMDEGSDRAKELHAQIVKEGNLELSAGAAIVTLEQMPFKTPRGRFTIDMFRKFLILRGRNQDHKIMYKSILRLYLLPTPDERNVVLVISLDPPIRQGQTRYAHLLISFKAVDELDVSLNMTKDELDAEFDKFEADRLEPNMSGVMFEVVSKIFKHVTGNRIRVPGSFGNSEDGVSGKQALKCSVGASDGLLYPLESSMLFIHKPILIIRFRDIAAVEFLRVTSGSSSSSGKTFDLSVTTKASTNHTFVNIPRSDYDKLYDFLRSRNVNIKSVRTAPTATSNMVSFDALDLGDEGPVAADSEDDDDDFQASESADDSLEFESDDDDDDSGDADDEPKRSKSKRKKKKKRSRSVSDDDDDDDAGASGSPKKAKGLAGDDGNDDDNDDALFGSMSE